MHAVQIQQWGETPKYQETEDLAPPTDDKQIQLKVKATGLHMLVRGRAAGTHYSAKTLPHTLGVDGVGTGPDGCDYYFHVFAPGASTGSFSDRVNVWKSTATPLPEGADAVKVAALFNPAMSSWMAIKLRCMLPLPDNFTVLIINATSVSGRVAAHIVRILGAGRVIGAARTKETLDGVTGLDERVVFAADDQARTDYSAVAERGVDLVLDYLWGPAAVAFLKQSRANTARPLQYVQIGNLAAPETQVPADVFRSKTVVLTGTGPGSWAPADLARETPAMIEAIGRIPDVPLRELPLSEVEQGWADKKQRVVFTL